MKIEQIRTGRMSNEMCEVRPPVENKRTLLQDFSSAVDDALKGIVMTNQGLVLLEESRIIMRRDQHNMHGKVKIIAGGGAGLEPAEACYVGAGMLTAAVIGDIFTSPPANFILRAIRELGQNHPEGILLLAKNYIGDKLNFGLALERAASEGIVVKMLVIGEDGADRKTSKMGRRGLAGSVLVYKIAGAMAEDGKSLEEIFTTCRDVSLTDLSTVTLALSQCSLPGCGIKNPAIKDNEIVFGLGPHGQAGIKTTKIKPTAEAVNIALEYISSASSQSRIKFDDCPVAVLINNLGGSSKIEELVVAMETIKQLSERQVKVVRRYSGSFMPSLDMKGFSITVLKVTSPDTTKYLDASTSAPGWPRSCCARCADPKAPLDTELPLFVSSGTGNKGDSLKQLNNPEGPQLSENASLALDQITGFAVESLISCSRQLDVMDSEAGDKDTGIMLKRGAEAVRRALKEGDLKTTHPCSFLRGVGFLVENAMGGTQGALYGVFFTAGSKVFLNATEITADVWCQAFKAGVKAIKHYGKAELGDRSMLDSLCPAIDALETALMKNLHPTSAVYIAAATCEFHSEKTKLLPPQIGRAAKSKIEMMYADPGAHATTIWLRAIAEGMKLKFPP